MSDPDLDARRLATLEAHFQSEVDHDWDTCIGTFRDTPRYEIVPTGQIHEGVDEVTAYHRAQRTAFPDQRHEHVRFHFAADTVTAEFDLLGTNTGEFMGSAPTGKPFRVAVIAVFAFDDDRITNERVYFDAASVVRQIGRDDLLPLIGVEGFTAQVMH